MSRLLQDIWTGTGDPETRKNGHIVVPRFAIMSVPYEIEKANALKGTAEPLC